MPRLALPGFNPVAEINCRGPATCESAHKNVLMSNAQQTRCSSSIIKLDQWVAGISRQPSAPCLLKAGRIAYTGLFLLPRQLSASSFSSVDRGQSIRSTLGHNRRTILAIRVAAARRPGQSENSLRNRSRFPHPRTEATSGERRRHVCPSSNNEAVP